MEKLLDDKFITESSNDSEYGTLGSFEARADRSYCSELCSSNTSKNRACSIKLVHIPKENLKISEQYRNVDGINPRTVEVLEMEIIYATCHHKFKGYGRLMAGLLIIEYPLTS